MRMPGGGALLRPWLRPRPLLDGGWLMAPGRGVRTTWLVGDVGGTNARFGLVSPDGAILHSATLAAADFGEGGHATMAPSTERENAVLAHLRQRLDHVSAERCLSGPGLVNLYNSLAALDGVPATGYTAAQITDPETGARDRLCREATAMFCA